MLTGTGSKEAQMAPAPRTPAARAMALPGPAGALAPSAIWSNNRRTWSRLRGRLSRPVPPAMPAIVTPAMASVAVGAFAATVFAAAFDPWTTAWMRQSDWPVWDVFHGVTHAAKSHVYLVAAGILAAMIGLWDWRMVSSHAMRGRMMALYAQSAFIFGAIAVPGIAINMVKQVVGRGRPRVFDELGAHAYAPFEFSSAFQSFPSGHATTAGSLAMLIALWYPRHAVIALVAGAGLAFARVPANAHHLSDVIAGYAIGTLATLAMARWLARRACLFRMSGQSALPRLVWADQRGLAPIPPLFGGSHDPMLRAEKEHAR